MIRVLVVDDSALMRNLIPSILSTDPGIEVVGTAMDGIYALEKIVRLHPDVVTLDIAMPRMDGIETLRNIVREHRIPVIIVSSLAEEDALLTFEALQIGAFDFVTKPQRAISTRIHEVGSELVAKVKAAVGRDLGAMKLPEPPPADPPAKARRPPERRRPADRVLAIGTSTGGPNALSYLLPRIPADFPAGILVVQHMPEGFTAMFAKRLDSMCSLNVKEAAEGDLVVPGRVLIAPGDRHLGVKRLPFGTIAVVGSSPPVNSHRPSVDVLFRSVAEEYGSKATGLIMTGMGSDGADGIGEILRRGGVTIAQGKESCVIFGMPKVAIEKKNISHVVALKDMNGILERCLTGRRELTDGKHSSQRTGMDIFLSHSR